MFGLHRLRGMCGLVFLSFWGGVSVENDSICLWERRKKQLCFFFDIRVFGDLTIIVDFLTKKIVEY